MSRTHVRGACAVALACAALIGCGAKKLSKEEAVKLVDAASLEGRKLSHCHLTVGSKVEEGRYETIIFDRAKCTDAVVAANLIDGPHGVTVSAVGGTILRKGALAIVPCEGGKCELRAACGKTVVQVDSITTEGRKATVEYTLKHEFPDVLLHSPMSCGISISDQNDERGTLVATLNDDGRWIAQK